MSWPLSARKQPRLRAFPLIPTRCSPVSHRALAVSSCTLIAVDSSSQLRSPPGWPAGGSTATGPCTSTKTAASTRREHMRPGAEETAGTFASMPELSGSDEHAAPGSVKGGGWTLTVTPGRTRQQSAPARLSGQPYAFFFPT